MQFSISQPARWLHTRCFSEPAFQPSRAMKHPKNIAIRDFATSSCTLIFFLLTLFSVSLSLSLSSDSFFSLTLPTTVAEPVQEFGSLTFKFPLTKSLICFHQQGIKRSESRFQRHTFCRCSSSSSSTTTCALKPWKFWLCCFAAYQASRLPYHVYVVCVYIYIYFILHLDTAHNKQLAAFSTAPARYERLQA